VPCPCCYWRTCQAWPAIQHPITYTFRLAPSLRQAVLSIDIFVALNCQFVFTLSFFHSQPARTWNPFPLPTAVYPIGFTISSARACPSSLWWWFRNLLFQSCASIPFQKPWHSKVETLSCMSTHSTLQSMCHSNLSGSQPPAAFLLPLLWAVSQSLIFHSLSCFLSWQGKIGWSAILP